MSEIKVKLVLPDEDIRRQTVDAGDAYTELVEYIVSAGFARRGLVLRYRDEEGDLVTIGSHQELVDAGQNCSAGSKSCWLRVFVQAEASKETKTTEDGPPPVPARMPAAPVLKPPRRKKFMRRALMASRRAAKLRRAAAAKKAPKKAAKKAAKKAKKATKKAARKAAAFLAESAAISFVSAMDKKAGKPNANLELATGWAAATDPISGKVYYYNATTRHTTWYKPCPKGDAVSAPVPVVRDETKQDLPAETEESDSDDDQPQSLLALALDFISLEPLWPAIGLYMRGLLEDGVSGSLVGLVDALTEIPVLAGHPFIVRVRPMLPIFQACLAAQSHTFIETLRLVVDMNVSTAEAALAGAPCQGGDKVPELCEDETPAALAGSTDPESVDDGSTDRIATLTCEAARARGYASDDAQPSSDDVAQAIGQKQDTKTDFALPDLAAIQAAQRKAEADMTEAKAQAEAELAEAKSQAAQEGMLLVHGKGDWIRWRFESGVAIVKKLKRACLGRDDGLKVGHRLIRINDFWTMGRSESEVKAAWLSENGAGTDSRLFFVDVHPDERHAGQLSTLESMGFQDAVENRRVIDAANGRLDVALESLISS